MMPRSCAASSASAICRAMFNASFSRRPRDRLVSPVDSFGERLAIDQLEHQSAYPAAFGNPVDGADVWMVEGREQPGFALEARPVVRVSHPVTGENLDGHRAAERRVMRPIHLAHATGAEEPCNRVRFELRAWCERVAALFSVAGKGCQREYAQRRRDWLLEESASVAIGSEQRLDIGLQRAVVVAAVTYQSRSVLALASDRGIEYRLDPFPALAVTHVVTCGRPDVMRR